MTQYGFKSGKFSCKSIVISSNANEKSAISVLKRGGSFINLLEVSSTGCGFSTGSLRDSANADIKADARLKCVVGGVTYYIPLYDTPV